jgi:hypothetical protein
VAEPFVIFRCQPSAVAGTCQLDRAADEGLSAEVAAARKFLITNELWQVRADPVLVVVGAPVAVARTVWDLGDLAGSAFRGRPGVLLEDARRIDADVLTHELVHLWLRQAGAREPRWRLVERRGQSAKADGEASLIQEGLADFVAAARRGSPTIGETTARPSALRVAARCPEDLVGDEYLDSQVLSNALWRASEALTPRVVLEAIAASAPRAAGDLVQVTSALEGALARKSAAAAATWRQIASENGLLHCRDPITLTLGRPTSSRGEHFVLPGRSRFAEAPRQVRAPQAFEVAVPPGAETIILTLRITQKPSRVTVRWASHPGTRRGETPIEGWPVASASVQVPKATTRLTLALAHEGEGNLGYDDLTATATTETGSMGPRPTTTALLQATGGEAPAPPLPAISADACLLPLALLWAMARRSHLPGQRV